MQTTERPSTIPTAPDWWALVSSRLVIGLGVLLVFQLVLALFLDMRGVSLSPAAAQGPLLKFSQAEVSRIRITSGGKQSVVLEKTAKGWRIPSLWDFPAAEFRVSDLLAKLAGLQKRLPVATSQSGLKRFKVADDAYERRVTLEGDKGPLATLYVGESPSFRRVFVRAGDDKVVYEAEFAPFDVSDKADDWSDRNALHLKEKDVQRIELPGIILARDEQGAWKLAGLGAGENLDQRAVDDVVRKVSDLNFLSVLGKQDKPEYKQQKPVFQYKVRLASDETLTYRISKPEKGDDYVLKASSSPYYFSASKYTLDGLKDIKRASLIKAEKPQAKEVAPAAGAASTAPGKGQTPPPAAAPATGAPAAAAPAEKTPPAKPFPGGATPPAPAGQGQPPKAPGAAGAQAPAVQPAPPKAPSTGTSPSPAAQTPPQAAPAAESPSASAVPSASAKTPGAASPRNPAPQQPPAPASATESPLPASPSSAPTKAPSAASPTTPAAQESPSAPAVGTPTSKSPGAPSPSAAPGQTPSVGTSAAEGAGSTAGGSVPAAATLGRPGAGGQPPTRGPAASAGQGQAAPTQPAPAAQPAAPAPAAPAGGQQPPAAGAVQSSPAPGSAPQE